MNIIAELPGKMVQSFREAPPESASETHGYRQNPTAIASIVHAGQSKAERLDLLESLRQRRSKMVYGKEDLPLDGLMDVVARGILADHTAWPDEAEQNPIEVYVVVNRVQGLAQGIHIFDGVERTCAYVATLNDKDVLELSLQEEFCHAAVMISVAADLDLAHQRHGGHGYRLLMNRASSAVYGMWLEAVALGWVGCAFAGFIPSSVRDSLRSDGTSRHQLFALALGATPSSVR